MTGTDTDPAVQATASAVGGGPGEAPTKRRRWPLLVVPFALVAVVSGLIATRERPWTPEPVVVPPMAVPASGERARELLGEPPSKAAWFSGAWAAGEAASTERINGFADWRGTPVDAATVYPQMDTWQTIHDSSWVFEAFDGFTGVLAYGLPMLPEDGSGDFRSIVSGEHDWVYEQVARDMVSNGRGTSIVRLGWEGNGDWFPWNATSGDAAQYIAAYRHIVGVLHGIAPDLVVDFDLGCGTPLRGQQDRLDALTLLYPGDDVVDLVGCDFYDWHNTKSTDEASWQQSIRPAQSVGIADVADFARAHGKGATYPEWGLASPANEGVGDNPYFIRKMRSFFESNADVVVLESYFSEPAATLENSFWNPTQMPGSAELYKQLW